MNNNSSDIRLQQLPLSFGSHSDMGTQDFMVTECNKDAYALITSWPNWLTHGLLVYGPKGCGKSHLAHIFAEKILQTLAKPAAIKIVQAKSVNNQNVRRIANETQYLVVEDLQPANNDEALFHLFNIFNDNNRYMLWTADNAPQRLHFKLKDLQSRLNMLPAVAIKEPNDMMLRMLIAKLFNDRQLSITPDIMQYIITNCQRSFAYIEDLIAEIDAVSLAYQSSVNHNIVRKAMQILKEKDNKSPDLFDER